MKPGSATPIGVGGAIPRQTQGSRAATLGSIPESPWDSPLAGEPRICQAVDQPLSDESSGSGEEIASDLSSECVILRWRCLSARRPESQGPVGDIGVGLTTGRRDDCGEILEKVETLAFGSSRGGTPALATGGIR